MMWSKIKIVWRWEFLQRIRSKSFVFSLLFVPAVFFLFTVLPSSFADQSTDNPTLGISGFAEWQVEQMKQLTPSSIQLIPLSESILDSPSLHNAFDGVLYWNKGVPRLVIRTADHSAVLRSAVNDLLTKIRLQYLGLQEKEIDAATAPVSFELANASENLLQNYRMAITVVMMLFFAIFNSSGAFLRSLSEERHNRIMEVLIATVEPGTLMAGKILGLGCVGLLQLALWSGLGILLSDIRFLEVLSWSQWILVILYFMFGYLFYTGLFASIGSVLSSESDVQHLQAILSILGLLPAALLVVILTDPHSLLVSILSFFPLVTPTLMPLRIILTDVPILQVTATLTLMAASSFAMTVAAGKVFKAATLLQGTSASLSRIRKAAR